MINKIKVICAVLLILSMLGLSIISLKEGNWKPFTLGVLYSLANIVIFIV